jgi:hypothetical protein
MNYIMTIIFILISEPRLPRQYAQRLCIPLYKEHLPTYSEAINTLLHACSLWAGFTTLVQVRCMYVVSIA